MDIQRINVKLLAQAPAGFKLDPFLAIFGRWRHEESPEVWVDLADYAHMAQGQGIAIIGKRGNFSPISKEDELEKRGSLFPHFS